ncbi:DNA glycosylase AlkZ-like family protein [Cellulomonas composti]|uniref:Winged helix-turn-helix domain-containing protein n=1 Tax=Cellulomonas composti TaxID=266130 RepID=A0A511JD40_9CELL|nr:crosslink repair DNA glycosylase YcaQ family protein [Cellulomonas composti]GEL95918.1 hypothetical protein CCO02nite_25760 [Cellulomonas composti]
MEPVALSREDARRVAVRAQALTADRPDGVLDTVRRLGLVQHDPVAAVAPSAYLVLWSRLGSRFRPAQLDDALDALDLVELSGLIRPAQDLVLYRAEMAAWPLPDAPDWQHATWQWLQDNRRCHDDVLEALRADGPLTATELPDTCARPWRSSGWNNHKNVQMLLAVMTESGEVAVAGRRGREKLWDLAERIYPDEPPLPVEEARRERDRRRLRALGLVRWTAPTTMVEPLGAGDEGVPAVIEGVRGRWRLDVSWLDEPFAPRTALLSPLDRLVLDRVRMERVFEFDYTLEMYKPAAQRRWGYYALPVLHGDRLVGKVDAKADPAGGTLTVHAVHEDGEWSTAMRADVQAELDDLARWLELDLRLPG